MRALLTPAPWESPLPGDPGGGLVSAAEGVRLEPGVGEGPELVADDDRAQDLRGVHVIGVVGDPGGLGEGRVADAEDDRAVLGLVRAPVGGRQHRDARVGPVQERVRIPLDRGVGAFAVVLVENGGFTALRFPGGAWTDAVDMKPFQIDQFIAFTKQTDSLPTISVRLLGGQPETAAELVRYTNIQKKYGVTYWSIGNEPNLFTQLKQADYDYTIQHLNQEWRAIALAMQAVDPNIKLMGPELSQWNSSYEATPKDSAGRDWMTEFLKANGDLVDVVSFHRYPFPRSKVSGPPAIDELRQNAQEWDEIIIHARELIHQYAGRDLPIAVTEFNSAYDKSVGGEATPDSHYNAVWLADVLGRMIKNDVFMANQFAFAGRAGVGSWGLIGALDVYPSYYTYQLYKKFGNELLYSSSDEPDLSVYAARRTDSALTILVINRSREERTKPLQVVEETAMQADTWLFDAAHKAENVGVTDLSKGVTAPPQSVTLYVAQ